MDASKPPVTVWLVHATVGEWSDRSEWVSCAFAREEDAKAWVEHISAQARLMPEDDRWEDDSAGNYERWLAHMKTLDSCFSVYGADEPTTYTAGSIEVLAELPAAIAVAIAAATAEPT